MNPAFPKIIRLKIRKCGVRDKKGRAG